MSVKQDVTAVEFLKAKDEQGTAWPAGLARRPLKNGAVPLFVNRSRHIKRPNKAADRQGPVGCPELAARPSQGLGLQQCRQPPGIRQFGDPGCHGQVLANCPGQQLRASAGRRQGPSEPAAHRVRGGLSARDPWRHAVPQCCGLGAACHAPVGARLNTALGARGRARSGARGGGAPRQSAPATAGLSLLFTACRTTLPQHAWQGQRALLRRRCADRQAPAGVRPGHPVPRPARPGSHCAHPQPLQSAHQARQHLALQLAPARVSRTRNNLLLRAPAWLCILAAERCCCRHPVLCLSPHAGLHCHGVLLPQRAAPPAQKGSVQWWSTWKRCA